MARERKTDLEKIRQQLRKMAFGKPNDCVKLALCEDVDIEKLDLSMLTEIKRSEKGTVEIKLLDRTKVLEQLAALENLTMAPNGSCRRWCREWSGKMTASFSEKQLRAMTWWMPKSRDHGFDALVCDGAVRSGKTLAMGLGFFLWAMSCFSGRRFALCGKTRGGVRRNVVEELLPWLRKLGMTVVDSRTAQVLTVRFGRQENEFYLFGGKDEGSAALIQGMTLAGVFLDEVVLMPRSFVEQACARCSVEGSRLWFSCNPEGPQHWFYKEWILQADKRNCLHLHFTMQDNPSLSQTVRRRYERLYTGVFYRRFILGQWCQAEGRVYDFFDTASVRSAPGGVFEQWVISCDYGTVNPASFGLWGKQNSVWYRTESFILTRGARGGR